MSIVAPVGAAEFRDSVDLTEDSGAAFEDSTAQPFTKATASVSKRK
jgi:hypothetical protein